MNWFEFNNDLLNKANILIKLEKYNDAKKDINKIDEIINAYNITKEYNKDIAIKLDETLREKYNTIKIISNYLVKPKRVSTKSSDCQPEHEPDEINRLKWDKNCILFSVLLEEMPTLTIEQFLVKKIVIG